MTDSILLDNDEDVASLRQQNKSWRSKARKLRRTNRDTQTHSDELFQALCQTDFDARQAFWELWARGELNCGPEDHQEIVERCLEALGIVRYIATIANHIPEASS
jgi:hypothetical protein